MASYFGLASKLERAARALLILQGDSKTDAAKFQSNGDVFISNDSRTRNVLPNRTCIVPATNPVRGYRPEGVLHLQIQHKFAAVVQPNGDNANPPDIESARVDLDAYLSATMNTFGIGDDDSDQAMSQLADALTAAGRWLATPSDDQNDALAAQIVKNNPDMLKFRVDWIKRAATFHVRGEADHKDSTIWVEILNFEAFVSQATN